MEIHGRFDPKFAPVREAFSGNFAAGLEVGASVAVTVDGTPVVDLWAGDAAMGGAPWQRDTIVNVYSTTKTMASLCVLMLADRGELDLDAPVARYWPEFAQNGKAEIPVRMLLSHRAGLPAIAKPLQPTDIFNWNTMTSALAEQKPWWTPGTKHGYHALTFGWLVGELVRRVSGMSIGRYVREHVAAPLGAEFWIGLPEELDARTADLAQGPIQTGEGQPNMLEIIQKDPEGMLAKTFANPLLFAISPNSREWRAAELAAGNGHTTADALARIYGALANGGELDGTRLLGRDAIERARVEQSYGKDEVLPFVSRFGLGFMMPPANEPLGPNSRVFGHGGAGGSLGLADPEAGFGLGYVMNLMHTGLWLVDPRPRALLAALYEAL
jgi:CubicO group peptidase (beta-lactamase class C family)